MFEESLGDRRAILMEGIYRFEFVLDKQDEKEIAKEASAFKEFLSRMDEGSIWE